MKYVTFYMSKGDNITLEFEQAQKVLESQAKIVMIHDKEGNWTGKTINKSFLVDTDLAQKTKELMGRQNLEEINRRSGVLPPAEGFKVFQVEMIGRD